MMSTSNPSTQVVQYTDPFYLTQFPADEKKRKGPHVLLGTVSIKFVPTHPINNKEMPNSTNGC